MFKAHRLKYHMDDRNKRRSLKVVSRKNRDTVSPYPLNLDSISMAAGVNGGSFKIHLEKTEWPSGVTIGIRGNEEL